MHHFHYSGQSLHCESVDLAAVAQLYGTPTYVYSAATITDNYNRLARGLVGLDFQICYAMKANSNLALLRQFANLGAGFDLVSGGEIRRVIAAGADVQRSVFAGVGKTDAEIKLAREGVLFSFHFLMTEFSALENVMLPALKLGKFSREEIEANAMAKLKQLDMDGFAHKRSSKLSGAIRTGCGRRAEVASVTRACRSRRRAPDRAWARCRFR